MVEIVAVPFDLCGPHHGSRLGALAMHLEGLEGALARIGVSSRSSEIAPVDARMPGNREECDRQGLAVYRETRDKVSSVIQGGDVPLVIGGDHSISIGSISGALKALGSGLAVLWVDAHMDVNTPETTPSGNLHGMTLGALAGMDSGLEARGCARPWDETLRALWPRLLEIVPRPCLRGEAMGWLGLRDVDPGEVRNAALLPGNLVTTMQDVDMLGLSGVVEKVDVWLRQTGAQALWVSFDVDVLDPIYAPGTGTAVRGGLSYREGHLLAESLHRLFTDPSVPYRLAGLDVVEVNPLRDRGNETARVAVEWVASLFGKTILHTLDPGRTER